VKAAFFVFRGRTAEEPDMESAARVGKIKARGRLLPEKRGKSGLPCLNHEFTNPNTFKNTDKNGKMPGLCEFI